MKKLHRDKALLIIPVVDERGVLLWEEASLIALCMYPKQHLQFFLVPNLQFSIRVRKVYTLLGMSQLVMPPLLFNPRSHDLPRISTKWILEARLVQKRIVYSTRSGSSSLAIPGNQILAKCGETQLILLAKWVNVNLRDLPETVTAHLKQLFPA